MKSIEALIAEGGEISVGAGDAGKCRATANDGHNSLAMLVRRDGETVNALLKPVEPGDRQGHGRR
jgi:hypothetical protein